MSSMTGGWGHALSSLPRWGFPLVDPSHSVWQRNLRATRRIPTLAPLIIQSNRALLIAFAITTLLLVQGANAATPVGARETINVRDLQRHVGFLASDTLEGRAAGTRGGQAAATYLAGEFRRLGLTPAGDSGDYLQEFGRGYRNVLALLPGSDPELQDEVILLGGHFDHVGYGKPGNSFGPFGQIHNGADDNASGTAGILEVAEACAQLDQRPLRSILFALWDAEEDGMLGSKHWVESRTQPLDHVRLVLNVDMIGRLRDERVTVYGTRTAAGLRRMASLSNLDSRLLLDFDAKHREDSDHWTFYQRRIPYLMFHTGEHEDYHRPSDDVDKLNYNGLERLSQLLFEVASAAADAPSLDGFRSEVLREESEASEPTGRRNSPSPSRLGISWNPRREQAEPLVITRVFSGSPAANAGLQPGDRIVQLNGRTIDDMADVVAAVLAAPKQSQLLIQRDGEASPREIPVTLHGTPIRLGVEWRTDAAEPDAVIVTAVIPGSPAAHAGLQANDRIYRTDGSEEPITDWFPALTTAANDSLELRIERTGKMHEMRVQLLPESPETDPSSAD